MIESWKKVNWTLVSGSSRRLSILKQIGISPEIIVPEIDELDHHLSPEELVKANSLRKIEFARSRVDSGILLAADTIVLLDHKILGKPIDSECAVEMLKTLSNRWHKVLTGFTLRWLESEKTLTDFVETDVHFRALSDEEIRVYVESGNPLDKAGGYGIQGAAGQFVDSLNGSYFNVVGLPISAITSIIQGWVDS